MSKTLFDEALKAEGVSGKLADLARSIYSQESGGGKNTKTSNAGAVGGMQILPKTFGSVADKDWSINDPSHNARAGIRYLKQLDKMSGGVPELTAAGYYGGPGGMAKAKQGIAVSDPRNPNAPNTLEYGQQVVARLGTPGSVGSRQLTPGGSPAASSFAVPTQVVVGGSSPAPDVPVVAQQTAPVEAPPVEAMNQADAWQEFLKAMPRGQPVNVADIDYTNPQPASSVPAFQFQPTRNQVPNFQAFSTWRGRAG
jgi:hypothetical protein